MQRLGVDVDAWPVPPAGPFVTEERFAANPLQCAIRALEAWLAAAVLAEGHVFGASIRHATIGLNLSPWVIGGEKVTKMDDDLPLFGITFGRQGRIDPNWVPTSSVRMGGFVPLTEIDGGYGVRGRRAQERRRGL